jgi:hypothetical protein
MRHRPCARIAKLGYRRGRFRWFKRRGSWGGGRHAGPAENGSSLRLPEMTGPTGSPTSIRLVRDRALPPSPAATTDPTIRNSEALGFEKEVDWAARQRAAGDASAFQMMEKKCFRRPRPRAIGW